MIYVWLVDLETIWETHFIRTLVWTTKMNHEIAYTIVYPLLSRLLPTLMSFQLVYFAFAGWGLEEDDRLGKEIRFEKFVKVMGTIYVCFKQCRNEFFSWSPCIFVFFVFLVRSKWKCFFLCVKCFLKFS